jgi:hypothetical protein
MSTNEVPIHGMVGAVQKAFNNGFLRVASFEFDTDGADSEGVSNKTVAAHGVGVEFPEDAIICGGFVDVNDAFTSSGSATMAVHVASADDIVEEAAVSGAPWSTSGRKAIVPKANTPESTSIKTDDDEITVTVGTAALTGGKLHGYLYYIVGEEDAE